MNTADHSYSKDAKSIQYSDWRCFQFIIGMSKSTVQLTEPIVRLFQGKNLAFVSTLMKDGSPQITPTWVDIEKNNEYSILVNTT
jgi:hypothetical protein